VRSLCLPTKEAEASKNWLTGMRLPATLAEVKFAYSKFSRRFNGGRYLKNLSR
jgi:hypothetical protein